MKSVPAPAGAGSAPNFVDGFGARSLAFDTESGDPVEILSFAREFVDAPGFASAIGERVARLARVRHTFYARTRRLDRPAEDVLHLVSDHVPGWRLSEVLNVVESGKLTMDISVILALMRQLIPAVALFSRHQRDAAIGTIGVERLILTPQSRLVLAEYVLAPGLEKLALSRERLWRDYRVALPHAANSTRIPPSADVVGMGIVAVSLLLGRLLKEDEYLVSLGDLGELLTESSGGALRPLSPAFGTWIARALQFDEAIGFQTPHEAQLAFEEMLAKERAYVTTPAQLELFVSRVERLIGPPPEPVVPASVPVESPPADDAVSHEAPEATVGASALTSPPPESPADSPASEKPLTLEDVGRSTPSARTPAPATEEVELSTFEPVSAEDRGQKWTTRALAVLAALVLIEGAAIAWLVTRDAGPGLLAEGTLYVQSFPAAARVTIDREDRGVTPLTTELSPGAHILEVRVGRSEPRVIPIQIRAGVENSFYVELQSVSTVGGLDVRSNPPKARVTVDGQYRGVTPIDLRDLPPGDHDVLIEAGTAMVRQTVRIEPGITSQLIVPLAR